MGGTEGVSKVVATRDGSVSIYYGHMATDALWTSRAAQDGSLAEQIDTAGLIDPM